MFRCSKIRFFDLERELHQKELLPQFYLKTLLFFESVGLAMLKDTRWVIVDTETDGLYDPIRILEIAAQRMRGWKPEGEPFQVYLNHQISIPYEATAIHGLTKEFLDKEGIHPHKAHEAFKVYLNDLPIVAHNLNYDWNRCLLPEWQRLCVPVSGRPGFCTMLLARRLLPETRKVNLETLCRYFGIDAGRAHSASSDVQTVVSLFNQVFRVRLESAQITDFDDIVRFSKKSPIKKCHTMLGGGC